MAVDVTFTYCSVHTVDFQGGYISYKPALPQSGRLYVIYNDSTDRPFYIGTAQNVQTRFAPRLEVMREMGFSSAQLDEISIRVVQIQTDGRNTPPDNQGCTSGIVSMDVEHLLIRTYVMKYSKSVRNMNKSNTKFINDVGDLLRWTLVDNVGGIPELQGRLSFNLGSAASL